MITDGGSQATLVTARKLVTMVTFWHAGTQGLPTTTGSVMTEPGQLAVKCTTTKE